MLDIVKVMYNVAEALCPYSWPKVKSDDEKDIICLKERELYIDGYHVNVIFSKNDHNNHVMYTLQIYPSFGSFLPFSLVCKLSKLFLGSKGVYYVSVIRNERKIYIWTLCKNLNGDIISDRSYDNIKEDNYMKYNFFRVLNVDHNKFF